MWLFIRYARHINLERIICLNFFAPDFLHHPYVSDWSHKSQTQWWLRWFLLPQHSEINQHCWGLSIHFLSIPDSSTSCLFLLLIKRKREKESKLCCYADSINNIRHSDRWVNLWGPLKTRQIKRGRSSLKVLPELFFGRTRTSWKLLGSSLNGLHLCLIKKKKLLNIFICSEGNNIGLWRSAGMNAVFWEFFCDVEQWVL